MKTSLQAILTQHMTLAIENSVNHVARGGLPFAALVVDHAGRIIGRGVNRVSQRSDPTAHAEVEAVRDACDHLGQPRIQNTMLLATAEPCAFCLMAAAHAGITSIYFAVDRNEAACHGFDYRNEQYRASPKIATEKLSVANRFDPFLLFLDLRSKRETRARSRAPAVVRADSQ